MELGNRVALGWWGVGGGKRRVYVCMCLYDAGESGTSPGAGLGANGSW